MKKFTAILHQGEPQEGGFWATCLEVPGANGQGETKDECLENLGQAIQLMLENGPEEPLAHDTSILSESALAEDWNRPEEDKAWAHLKPDRSS